MAQADHFAEKYGEPFVKLLFNWFINSGTVHISSKV
jgi:hypothetical protein